MTWITFTRVFEARLVEALSATVLARHNDGVAFSVERISPSGARLVGPLTLEVGEQVRILFDLEGTPIDVEGEVVRVDRESIVNDHVAVAFKNVSPDARALIHALVQRSLDADDQASQLEAARIAL